MKILMLVLYISVGLLMCGLSLPLIWRKVRLLQFPAESTATILELTP